MKTSFTALGTTIFLLGLAVLATIYGAWLIYPLEIKWLNLTDTVILSDQTIWNNFNHLMNYLTNPFNWVLGMPDFPSSPEGLYHFEAVKKLFHLAQVVTLGTFPVAILFFKKFKTVSSTVSYYKLFLGMAVLPIVLGLVITGIGFSTFFVVFHQVLFPGDSTWLFDPNLDPVIQILPENYFLHCFILFFICYEVCFVSVTLWIRNHRLS